MKGLRAFLLHSEPSPTGRRLEKSLPSQHDIWAQRTSKLLLAILQIVPHLDTVIFGMANKAADLAPQLSG